MYRKHFFISAFIALSFLAVAVSCKKDDDSGTTYSDSMTGTLSFDISQYLLVGETVTIDATGITEPDDVTYTWTGSLIGDRDGQYGNDTITGVQSISLTVRDEVGTFTITVKAEADGYYSKQYSKDVVVISPDGTDGSLTDIEYTGKTFRDPRDGKIYNYTTAGNLDWRFRMVVWPILVFIALIGLPGGGVCLKRINTGVASSGNQS